MIDTTNMSIMASLIQAPSNTITSNMISKKDENSNSALNINEMGISSELFSSYDLDSDSLLSKSELSTAIDTAMSEFSGAMPSKEEFQSVLSNFGFQVPINSSSNNLSSSQKDTISSVLENYDANNLSQSDALEIVAAFKEAGIQPSSELESTMKEAGFDAKEVGTLAGVESQGQAGSGRPSGGGGGSGGGSSSSSEDEDYDVMDTNEDGFVSAAETEEYYRTSSEQSTGDLSLNKQNSLDNLQLLMQTLKSNSEDNSIDTKSFDGLVKAINNQNNNSEINTYLQNNQTSSIFDYA